MVYRNLAWRQRTSVPEDVTSDNIVMYKDMLLCLFSVEISGLISDYFSTLRLGAHRGFFFLHGMDAVAVSISSQITLCNPHVFKCMKIPQVSTGAADFKSAMQLAKNEPVHS